MRLKHYTPELKSKLERCGLKEKADQHLEYMVDKIADMLQREALKELGIANETSGEESFKHGYAKANYLKAVEKINQLFGTEYASTAVEIGSHFDKPNPAKRKVPNSD